MWHDLLTRLACPESQHSDQHSISNYVYLSLLLLVDHPYKSKSRPESLNGIRFELISLGLG